MTLAQVKEFNTTFGVAMSSTPTTRVPAAGLRYELIREEVEEYNTAKYELDIVEIADALGDILYVAHGAALVFGVDHLLKPVPVEKKYGVTLIRKVGQETLLEELRNGILGDRPAQVASTLSHIISDAYALAETYGLDLDPIVDAIHTSNMSKLGEDGKPIYREGDGKVLKGPNYKTPTDDIRKLVFGDNYAPASE